MRTQEQIEADLEPYIQKQMDKLRQLKPNWDGEGSPIISEAAIIAAANVLRHMGQLTPCSDGGVQIDWSNFVEMTFGPDGKQDFE